MYAAKQDYQSFYNMELKTRQLGMYPPYCYLTSVLLSGKDELAVERCAEGVANFLNGKLKNVNSRPVWP